MQVARGQLENQSGPLAPWCAGGWTSRSSWPRSNSGHRPGIVFLMTTKPDAAGSVVPIALAVVFSLPALKRARQRGRLSEQPA
jgi:hypothetical protein